MSSKGQISPDGSFEPVRRLLKIDFEGSEPLYTQITRQLEALISSGKIPEGTTLPSERRLADLLGVSRITAQNSYNALRQLGLIQSHGRRGSIVQKPGARILSPMNRLRGFTEEMRDLGRTPTSRIIRSGIRQDRQIATIFSLPSSARLLYLERIRYADDVPLSHEKAWYNLAAVPALEDSDLSGSMYAHLAQAGHPLAYCEQVIEAILPSEAEREILGIENPISCMLIKRHSYSKLGTLLEYVEGTFRGDVYSYRITLPV